MELFEKLIPLILGMFKFNVNFDINVNIELKSNNIKTIIKKCLLIIIISIACYALSISSEPSITVTEEPSVTLADEPSVTLE